MGMKNDDEAGRKERGKKKKRVKKGKEMTEGGGLWESMDSCVLRGGEKKERRGCVSS